MKHTTMMNSRLSMIVAAALLAASVGPVLAQGTAPASTPARTNVLPKELPAYGKEKALPALNITRHTLANGLKVWVLPRNSLPRVDAVLAVRGAGSAGDDALSPGFSDLLAGLLNEGSSKRDARAIAEAAQALGGSVGASSGSDGITVTGYSLASKAEPMLQLLAEVARLPAFPDSEVTLAKANALQALKASSATPRFRAEGALGKAIYGDHPYGNTQPTAAAIEATTPAALRAAHAQRFRPDHALLIITGRVQPQQALKMAQAAFGDWQAQGTALPDTPAAPTSAAPARLLLERPGSVQATLRVGRPGVPASDPDYVPLRVASGVMGEGFSSRINVNLREEKGYTYGASARARNLRNGGSIVGGADVRNEVTGASLKEFDAEYRRIGSELVPEDEMLMTKRYLAGSFLVGAQMQGRLANTIAQQWLIGLPPEFLSDYVPQLMKVSAEQVRDVGRKYFAPETQSIVVVGDKAAISEQLKAWGEFKTVPK